MISMITFDDYIKDLKNGIDKLSKKDLSLIVDRLMRTRLTAQIIYVSGKGG